MRSVYGKTWLVVLLAMMGANLAMGQIQGVVTTREGRKIEGAIKWLPRRKAFGITAKGGNVELEMAPNAISEMQIPRPRELDAALASIKQGNAAAAVPVLEKLSTDYLMLQWDAIATRYLAEAHLKAGNAQAALGVCEKIITANAEAAYLGEMAPPYWQALLTLGRTSRLEDALGKAVKSGDRRTSAFALMMRGDMITAEGETPEITKRALRDGYLRVVTLYRNEKDAQPEALYKAAKCFEKLGQTARADQLRTTLRNEFGASEWAGKG